MPGTDFSPESIDEMPLADTHSQTSVPPGQWSLALHLFLRELLMLKAAPLPLLAFTVLHL